MLVVITGASGLLGANLADLLLREGHRVRGDNHLDSAANAADCPAMSCSGSSEAKSPKPNA